MARRSLLPVVVFCFSKRRVDMLAGNLGSLDLASAAEKSDIQVFCERAVSRLRGSDRELPQVLAVREMVKRGLGVHHAGARNAPGRARHVTQPLPRDLQWERTLP
jgi:antiviral helicase SKI2